LAVLIILKATAKQAVVILFPQQHKCATVVCHIMRTFLLLASFLLTKPILGQSLQLSTPQIDSIVRSIDSTKELRNAVVDGILRPKGKRKPKGGFSDTYLIMPTTNKLVKVERGESLYYLDFTTYYLYQDSLIFVNTVRHNVAGDPHKEVSSGAYYFLNGTLIDKRELNQPLSRPEVFLIHARRYLTEVKSVFNL
jgi:hypothetical protein